MAVIMPEYEAGRTWRLRKNPTLGQRDQLKVAPRVKFERMRAAE
jgi:hypothetical protein